MRREPANRYELEAYAKGFIRPHAWDSIAGEAHDEITVKRNRTAEDAITLRPRFLEDIANRDLSTNVLGEKISFPVMVAPAFGHQSVHPDGGGGDEHLGRADCFPTGAVVISGPGSVPTIIPLWTQGPLPGLAVPRLQRQGHPRLNCYRMVPGVDPRHPLPLLPKLESPDGAELNQ